MVDSKPFDDPYQRLTLVHNNILDHIMPRLSAEGWKVLCAVLRHTQGHPGLAPANGGMSAAQLGERTGIREATVLDGAIQECVDMGYLVHHPSDGSEPAYILNRAYDFEARVDVPVVTPDHAQAYQALVDFGHETEAPIDATQVQEAVSQNELEAVLAWIETGREMTDRDGPARFQTVVQRLLQRIPPLPRELLAPEPSDEPAKPSAAPSKAARLTAEELWQATLAALKSRVRKSKMQWFKPTRGEALSEHTLVVSVPSRRTKEWLEKGQLAGLVKEAVSEVAGSPMTLVFKVDE
jgi:hypothetical protein